MLYELSVMGPSIEDEFLMKHHSKLEDVLFKKLNVIKTFQDSEVYNTLQANQYTLYASVYEFLSDYEKPSTRYHKIVMTIEEYLSEANLQETALYYDLRYKNQLRFNYWYAILSSQVSMYQDYTGLSVRPWNTGYINLKDNYFCFAPEMNSGVMLTTSKSIDEALTSLKDYVVRYDVNTKDMRFTTTYLEQYLENYNQYITVRSGLPYDFFKSGEFTEYQILDEREFNGFEMYYFDHQYDELYHFNVMVANYYALQTAIKIQPHINYMMY